MNYIPFIVLSFILISTNVNGQSLKEDANYFSSYYKGTYNDLDNAPEDLFSMKCTMYLFKESQTMLVARNTGNKEPVVTKIKINFSKGIQRQTDSNWCEGYVTEGTELGKNVVIIFYKGGSGFQIVYDATFESSDYHLGSVAIREIFHGPI